MLSKYKNKIITGNAVDILNQIPDKTIDMCLTSPPYWSLRDYSDKTITIWGGKKDCNHEWQTEEIKINSGMIGLNERLQKENNNKNSKFVDNFERPKKAILNICKKCGAYKGQLGLEKTPDLYLYHLQMIFSEVKKVLKDDSSCWIVMGDTYCGDRNKQTDDIFKPRSLMMIPERFVFMMINLGFVLRNKIVWRKLNPMPSSVKNRLNCTWEYLYFFTNNQKYFFDLDAIRIPSITKPGFENKNHQKCNNGYFGDRFSPGLRRTQNPLGKNPGDVWDINTHAYSGAHFAAFPMELCKRPILAGSPKYGMVLDPFCGSGTTCAVAKKLGRNYIGIDINEDFCKLAQERINKVPERLDKWL